MNFEWLTFDPALALQCAALALLLACAAITLAYVLTRRPSGFAP